MSSRRALFVAALACAACGDDDVIVRREGPTANRTPDGGVAISSDPNAPFRIVSFTSSSANVEWGEAVTLSWIIEGAPAALELDGVSVSGTSNKIVVPARRQTYELVARGGTARDAAKVTVASRGIDVFAGVLESPGSLDGPAHDASFQRPDSIAYDAAGNAYVTDWSQCTVRKIDVAGNVTTIAGTFRVCEAKDGKGAAAHFRSPMGVAVGADGTVYVADYLGKGVRAIAADGTVTTIAEMVRPRTIFVMPNGDLLVGDGQDGTIRRITPDHQVSLAYGVPNDRTQHDSPAVPTFVSVEGFVLGPSGDLFVADACSVRKIAVDGTVSTYAGTPGACDDETTLLDWYDVAKASAKFTPINGIAGDAAGNLYVVDNWRNRLRRIDAISGIVSSIAGGDSHPYGSDVVDGFRGAATFASPGAIVALPNGAGMGMAETGSSLVRTVTFAGNVTTVAGTTARRGAFDGARGTNRIGMGTAFAFDTDGSVAFADSHNHIVRRIRPDGSVVTIAGSALAVGSVDGPAPDARFFAPWGLAGDGKGALFVTSIGGGVRKIDPAGTVSTFAATSGFTLPRAVVRDSKGDLVVADMNGAYIRKVKPDGTVVPFAGNGPNWQFKDGTGTGAEMVYPDALAIDADDNVYFADAWGRVIRKASPDGTVVTIAGGTGVSGHQDGPAKQATFGYVRGLAVDSAKNVYIADEESDLVRMLSPDGIVSTIAGTTTAHGSRAGKLPGVLYRPYAIAVTKDGDLLVGGVGWIAQITR